MYKLGARHYEAAQGRFTQMDPSGQERNPSAYASCNPINSADPSGLAAVSGDCWLAYAGVLLAAVGVIATTVTAPATLGGSLILGAATASYALSLYGGIQSRN
ncbi:RHS repeat-associated core domain-containing protein [Microbacterium halimionae]|uniref:RHS repeat-associated core domain-containing protein n=1 Tax=Microbacterium halimionae TaxID=1526413 RepID=UPI002872BAF9|nr:RHS repeat-associated core domain-containing protein [Microbacterium halimionae]